MGENGQASLLLRKQLAELNKNPVEGFSAGLIDESDIFKWEVNDEFEDLGPSLMTSRLVELRIRSGVNLFNF